MKNEESTKILYDCEMIPVMRIRKKEKQLRYWALALSSSRLHGKPEFIGSGGRGKCPTGVRFWSVVDLRG